MGLIAYIILWIVTPEAKTTAEKLQMEGERVTIDNIEKNNAIINYDTFTTKTNLSKLEIVK